MKEKEGIQTTDIISSELTFLHAGVQLCDLDGQAVYAVLERVGAHIKSVGLVEKLAKNIFCLCTCNQSRKKGKEGNEKVFQTQNKK